jgi:ribose transport system permease protein
MNDLKRRSLKDTVSLAARNSTFVIGCVLILMIIVASVFSPYFLDPFNLQSLMRDLAFVGMVAVAQAMLLLIGELDLSVGTMASLAGILGGLLMTKGGVNPYIAFIIGVLLGGLFGLINGLIVTRLRLNSMVTTIGMTGVYGGITLVITKGRAITKIPEAITGVGKGNFLGIPIPFYIGVIVMVLLTLFVRKTKTGRYIYAIGNSRTTAEMLGIKVDNIRVLCFTIVGFVSALAGMLYVARLGSAQASIGSEWPMNSIAASVIGGVALSGGIGNPIGSFIGAAIISIIGNMIVLFGVNIYWQQAVSGIVVVVAIALPSLLSIMRERKRIKLLAKEQK